MAAIQGKKEERERLAREADAKAEAEAAAFDLDARARVDAIEAERRAEAEADRLRSEAEASAARLRSERQAEAEAAEFFRRRKEARENARIEKIALTTPERPPEPAEVVSPTSSRGSIHTLNLSDLAHHDDEGESSDEADSSIDDDGR